MQTNPCNEDLTDFVELVQPVGDLLHQADVCAVTFVAATPSWNPFTTHSAPLSQN
jgi:hypothetical protein